MQNTCGDQFEGIFMAVRSEHLTPVRREAPTARKKGQTIKKLRRMIAAGQDYYDYNLLAVVILLTSFGLIMLYSATAYKSMINSETQSTMSYFGKQTLISIAALGIGFFVSRLDYHYLARFAAPLYEASLVLLFLTRFIGREVNGAKRWIYIGPISFQPAEMAKLAVILFIPVLIVKIGKYIERWKSVFIVLGFGGLTAGFTYIFTQNLSTATIILGIVVALIFIAHPKTAPFLKVGAAGLVLLAILLVVLINMSGDGGSFRIQRIQTWLHPEAQAGDNGYQILKVRTDCIPLSDRELKQIKADYDRNTLLYKKSKGTLKLSKTSKYDDSDGLSEPTKAPAIHIEKSLKSSTRLPAVCLGGGIAIALLTVLWVYLYSDNN